MNDVELLSAVIVAVVIAFYFMFMRPVQKEQARRKQDMRDLRPGDEVLTTSGFIATVRDIKVAHSGTTHILLEMADGVIFTATPMAVLERISTADAPAPDRSTEGTGLPS